MNIDPGGGLGIGTAILCGLMGQELPESTPFVKCKLHGILLNSLGAIPGRATRELVPGTAATFTDGWQGVPVNATLQVADGQAGVIIGVDKVSTTTNDHGYFEFSVIQGLVVVLSAPSFGKTVTIATTGETDIDVSTLF